MKLRVVVADDNPAVLRRLVSLLETECEVVAAAENGRVALEWIRRCQPDVAVLDLEMPVLNGIEATRELRASSPTPAVVICSVENDPEIIATAQQVGALGFVFKLRMARDLIPAIKSVARGESFISRP
jgi:DNA-binding NarL/FixJ family response regulator